MVSTSPQSGGQLLDWERERFERVIARLGLPAATRQTLHLADRSLIVELPLQRDDGSLLILTGYRVQHSRALGPSKGGTRYRPGTSITDVTALARLMTWKNALHGLPFGGGKGGIDVDPNQLSPRELQEATRLYTLAILPVLGSDVDIPAPDVGTNAQTMAWMARTAFDAGHHDVPVVTGKPPLLGGSRFRDAATGVGTAHVAARAWELLGHDLKGARVAVEGFGNVGRWAAREVASRGALIVAVANSSGALADETGIDVVALDQWLGSGRPISDFPAADGVDTSIHSVPHDITIAAAVEGTVTADVARATQARLVVEGANGPTTPDAEAILQERGVAVVPDLVANAGGVVSSYFEWAQNHQRIAWGHDEERRRVLATLDRTWDQIGRHDPDEWRDVALSTAISRVVEAMELGGQVAAAGLASRPEPEGPSDRDVSCGS